MSGIIGLFLVVFVFGALIGSFLNVCIARIPEHKSVVSPPSHCPQCMARIRWYQNIPVVSYLALRGRCAGCGQVISIRYLLVEVLTGLLFAQVFFRFGFQYATLLCWILVSLLVVITFIDLDYQIIPDVLSLSGIGAGLAGSILVPWIPWTDSLLGVLLGGGLLYAVALGYELLAKREGMGGGDIKLLAMLGAFLGWKSIFPIILLSSLIGTLVGVPWMLFKKRDARFAIPFGPFLAVAALVYLFWGGSLIRWYLSFFHI
jgi:leader peptidase (prepilin peptidase) / N-methyltransferase